MTGVKHDQTPDASTDTPPGQPRHPRSTGGLTGYSRTPMLLFASILFSAGCGGRGTAPGSSLAPDASSVQHGSMSSSSAVTCGQQFQPPTAGRLMLAGKFPTAVLTGVRMISGTVEVRTQDVVRGTVAPGADVFLVRDGRVATVPVPHDLTGIQWNLGPGKIEHLPGQAALVSCAPGGGPVRPGTYELYARVVITQDDGTPVESFGGPWPLEVH
jgi:hypothetical protein